VSQELYNVNGQTVFQSTDKDGVTIGYFSYPKDAISADGSKVDQTRAISHTKEEWETDWRSLA
jgi:hypothetical protein